MRFHQEIGYDADLRTVREIILDPVFREEVAREAGAVEVVAEVVEQADGTILATVATSQPTDAFPSAARRVLGTSLRIEQHEHWTDLTNAALGVSLPGQPGRVSGRIALREDGGRSTQVVHADIKVSIPFVGGKVEQMIGASLGYVLKLQGQVGARWLAG